MHSQRTELRPRYVVLEFNPSVLLLLYRCADRYLLLITLLPEGIFNRLGSCCFLAQTLHFLRRLGNFKITSLLYRHKLYLRVTPVNDNSRFLIATESIFNKRLVHKALCTVCLHLCSSCYVCGKEMQSMRDRALILFNPVKTKGRLLHIKIQFVPRSKHFTIVLQKPISLCCMGQTSLFVLR